MNKISNINLGGYPFTIDNDAYTHLENYLTALHRHFSASDGCEEIINDIEIRMAELLQERLEGRSIVTLRDVQQVINIMGTPEFFAAENAAADTAHTQAQQGAHAASEQRQQQQRTYTTDTYHTGKRFFRDPEDKVVGGVCSGLAAYFGIHDPVWVRIIFAILFFSGGFGVPIYFLLMIIVPYAKTSADRLQMRGEKIDIDNIAKMVEEGFHTVSEQFSSFGTGSKKKADGVVSDNPIRNFLADLFSVLGSTIRMVLEILKKIGKPLLVVIGVILITALVISWVSMLFGFYMTLPMMGFLTPESGGFKSALGVTNGLILIAVPIAAIAILMMRILYRTRVSGSVQAGMWAFWVLNFVSLTFIGASVAKEFNQRAEVAKSVDFSNFTNDTLQLAFLPRSEAMNSIIQMNDLYLDDDNLVSGHVYMNVEKSENQTFAVTEQHLANGHSQQEATQHANKVGNLVQWKNANQLSLTPQFVLEKGDKWRAQEVIVQVRVPVGKYIRFNEGFEMENNFTYATSAKQEGFFDLGHHTYVMEEDGLRCTDCMPEPTTTE